MSVELSPIRRSTKATTAKDNNVNMSMIVDTAAISGRSATFKELKMYTGHGVLPGTCTKLDTMVLSKLKVKAINAPAIIPGAAMGKVICQNLFHGLA